MTSPIRSRWPGVVAIASFVAAAGCGDVNSALEHLTEARRFSADILVQFTKAADASNRAVMSQVESQAVAAAEGAAAAKQTVRKDAEALSGILQGLGYPDETRLLKEFVSRFATYEEVDKRILDLAVENTNLKAQRLSFGAANEAADAFVHTLESIGAAPDNWHVKALVETAIAKVREIQALEGPHIADADDGVMTRIEASMRAAQTSAEHTLTALAPLVPAMAKQLAAARTSLDQFTALNAEITALSRRNTNVHSLALSLTEKPTLVAACEESATTLRDALAKRGYPEGR